MFLAYLFFLLIYQRNAYQDQDEHLMVVRISGKALV